MDVLRVTFQHSSRQHQIPCRVYIAKEQLLMENVPMIDKEHNTAYRRFTVCRSAMNRVYWQQCNVTDEFGPLQGGPHVFIAVVGLLYFASYRAAHKGKIPFCGAKTRVD